MSMPVGATTTAPAHSNVTIIGAGAWGTTLAILLARSRVTVSLITHSLQHAHELAARRENIRYLPGVGLPESIGVSNDLHTSAALADIIFLAVPSQHIREASASISGGVGSETVVMCCAKGFELATGQRLTDVMIEELRMPAERIGALSGPNLAREIAAGQPASTVVACVEHDTAVQVQQLLHSTNLRVYSSTDVVGVEFGGALKNVVAIGAGVADGLGLGQNAKAAFMTRGLAEMMRLGIAAGANPLTFGGLSGIGDLIATCESPLSRNRSFGEMLGKGQTPVDALATIPHVVEGVTTAAIAVDLGVRYGVSTPIADAIHGVLQGTISVQDAIGGLLARETRPELDAAM